METEVPIYDANTEMKDEEGQTNASPNTKQALDLHKESTKMDSMADNHVNPEALNQRPDFETQIDTSKPQLISTDDKLNAEGDI